MKNYKSGFAPILGIIIALAVIGVGGYFIYQKAQPNYSYQPSTRTVTPAAAPTPAPAPVVAPVTPMPVPAVANPDPTANWKTYKNEKYGFEIKYPQAGKISEVSNQLCDVGDSPGHYAEITVSEDSIVSHASVRISNPNVKVYCGNYAENINQPMIVDGKTLIAHCYIATATGEKMEYCSVNLGSNVLHTFLDQTGGKGYGVKISDAEYDQAKVDLLKMISTFRFTK